MKSMLFSALVIFALASTGCAIQNGLGGQGGGECSALSGDCGCGCPPGLDAPERKLLRRFGDNTGMGLRVNAKGSACNQGRNNGLFSRMGGNGSVAPAASIGGCGCDGGDTFVSMSDGGGCGCDSGDTFVSMSDGGVIGGGLGAASGGGCGCKLGGRLGGCGLGNCKLGSKLRGAAGGCGLGAAAGGLGVAGAVGGCGLKGCGLGGKRCGGCLARLAGGRLGAHHPHPYGGAIPHTAQAPGNGTGIAPSYAYPYYTTRGPRDFLMKNPPSIGY